MQPAHHDREQKQKSDDVEHRGDQHDRRYMKRRAPVKRETAMALSSKHFTTAMTKFGRAAPTEALIPPRSVPCRN